MTPIQVCGTGTRQLSAALFGGRVATSCSAGPPPSYGQWRRVQNDIHACQLLIETATPDAGVDRPLTHPELAAQCLCRTVLSLIWRNAAGCRVIATKMRADTEPTMRR
jgi:hypothetical protein